MQNVKAYVDGNSQRTKDITFNADTLQTITMKLPAGYSFITRQQEKQVKLEKAVEICGGNKVLSVCKPLTQVSDDGRELVIYHEGGSITKDYSAYKITKDLGTQGSALVFGRRCGRDEKYVDFKVSWIELATVEVGKKIPQQM